MGRLLMLWKGSFTGTWSAKDVVAVEVTTIRGSEDTGGCDSGFGHSQVGFPSPRGTRDCGAGRCWQRRIQSSHYGLASL